MNISIRYKKDEAKEILKKLIEYRRLVDTSRILWETMNSDDEYLLFVNGICDKTVLGHYAIFQVPPTIPARDIVEVDYPDHKVVKFKDEYDNYDFVIAAWVDEYPMMRDSAFRKLYDAHIAYAKELGFDLDRDLDRAIMLDYFRSHNIETEAERKEALLALYSTYGKRGDVLAATIYNM